MNRWWGYLTSIVIVAVIVIATAMVVRSMKQRKAELICATVMACAETKAEAEAGSNDSSRRSRDRSVQVAVQLEENPLASVVVGKEEVVRVLCAVPVRRQMLSPHAGKRRGLSQRRLRDRAGEVGL